MADAGSLPFQVTCVRRPDGPEDVDEQGYLDANPDVARAGQSARSHFIDSGGAQGRLQAVNTEIVRELRRRKLARITWRAGRQPAPAARDVLNFIPPDVMESFGIPEDVPVSAHPYGPPIASLIQDNPDSLFLDVGAGLRHIYYANVVNTDIYPSISTDVMCVGEDLPFADSQFDVVLCFAVLEHVMRPWDVAREMCRVLKPGGRIIVDWPFLQPVHGYPHHYFNATPRGNESLLEPYCDVSSASIEWHHHPAVAAHWMLSAWRNGLPPAIAAKFEAKTIGELIAVPVDDHLAQDWCTELNPDMKKAIASGSMVVGVRRPGVIAASTSAPRAYDRLVQENADLLNTLAIMRRSTSWRVTAPLRALGRLVRRPPARA